MAQLKTNVRSTSKPKTISPMKQIRYTISPDIFAKFPGYTRGLVVAANINNSNCAPAALQALRAAEAAIGSATTLETFLASPKDVSWREALRKTGANPSEFRPAHEALIRRALNGKPLPDINPAVNIGNALSIRHQLPVGVHPLDGVKSGMELRFARGDETFVAFGSDRREPPRIGEIVFADGNEIISRCWVWRQAKWSVTLSGTRAIVMNIDGLPPVSESEVKSVSGEAEEMIRAACGGEFSHHFLSAANPAVILTIP
jgi:DNA/RNA-binding domain of Phe-tRNA-synthetase-like protein